MKAKFSQSPDPIPTRRDDRSLPEALEAIREKLKSKSEELIEALDALKASRDRYKELYDFAPNGYITLNSVGNVVEANLMAGAILGKLPRALVGMPFLGFVENKHRNKALEFLKNCRVSPPGWGQMLTTRLRNIDGAHYVQLFSQVRETGKSFEILIALVDITDQEKAEVERDAARKERELLVGRMLSLQEDERRRISRDIHDHLGQRVTGLRLLLELAAQRCPDREVVETLAKAQEQAQRLDRDVDFFTAQLRPASLDDLGLVPTIDQFVRDWSTTFQIDAEFHLNRLAHDVRLEPEVEINLYRVTQEALNNAHKHAAPTRVSVILERRGHYLVLIIEDNGKGFDPAGVLSRHAGMGLLGMRERVALIGGTLEIESAPKSGTTLFIQVPWKAD